MDLRQLTVRVEQTPALLQRILASPLDHCSHLVFQSLGRGQSLHLRHYLLRGHYIDLLIPSEFPEPADRLHQFVLGHAGGQGKNSFRIARHLDVCPSSPRLIKDHKGFVFRNTCTPFNH
jgi:hypothetical protein